MTAGNAAWQASLITQFQHYLQKVLHLLLMRMDACNLFACQHTAQLRRSKQHLKLEQLLMKVIDGRRLVCAVHVFGPGKLISRGNCWIVKRSLKLSPEAKAPSYANRTYGIKPAKKQPMLSGTC